MDNPDTGKTEQSHYEPAVSGNAVKKTHTTHKYDEVGNVIEFFDAGDEGDADNVTAIITYTATEPACAANYIVGKAKTITVKGQIGLLRKRNALFDCDSGNMTQVNQQLNGTQAVTDLAYDKYGNLEQVIRPANVASQRYTLNYTYDSIVQTHIVGIRDSFGYRSSASYDYHFGKPAITTDINGNQTEYRYDELGRVSKIYGPTEMGGDNATLSFEYKPEATVPYAVTQHIDLARGDTIDT